MFIHLADGSMLDVNTLLSMKLAASDIAIPIDIQGISLKNDGEFLKVSLVDQAGNPVAIGGGATDSGGVMDFQTIVNKEVIRDGGVKVVNFPDLSKYVRYNIYVLSTLDKAVKIAPWQGTHIILDDGTIGRWAVTADATNKLNYSYVIPPKDSIGNGVFWLNEMTPKSIDGGSVLAPKTTGSLFTRVNTSGVGALKINYQTDGSPTTGDLTIRIIGYLK
ncbi:hypothetical protein PAECIP112173_00329 [Paenibacillus sp. JJ-100]|uniref:hypothetical protein n=1 Tax=Paenibacillus sp. JJ-100 TaxID=2974896 RepID=UPI0022FFA753|nr:hypothetical protein [Paenibacillus sp. JJ-100]CAI6023077.1 hypothetical protein PAECIP112173_00329 [Paenibacillus sp. JJ-100]